MQEHLYKHFESECHSDFRDNVSVIIIDRTDGSNPTKRLTCWMQTLRTIAPYGLSLKNDV